MKPRNNRNNTPRRPQGVPPVDTQVTHIHDPRACGRVVGHDTDEKGNYSSSCVYVNWEGEKDTNFCVSDELMPIPGKHQDQKKKYKKRNYNQDDEG